MSRILFVLAALGSLVLSGMLLLRGEWHLALAAAGIMVVFFVFAVVADRSGEGMPEVPRASSP